MKKQEWMGRRGSLLALCLVIGLLVPAIAGAGAGTDESATDPLDTTDEQRRIRGLVADAIGTDPKAQEAALDELARIGKAALPLTLAQVEAMSHEAMNGNPSAIHKHRGTIDFVMTVEEREAFDAVFSELTIKAIQAIMDDAVEDPTAQIEGLNLFMTAIWIGNRPQGSGWQYRDTPVKELLEKLMNAGDDDPATVDYVAALAIRGNDPRPITEEIPTPYIDYLDKMAAQFVKASALAETDTKAEQLEKLEEGLAALARRLKAGPEATAPAGG
jgi:hypothetical protein